MEKMKMIELLNCTRDTKAGNHHVEVESNGIMHLFYYGSEIVTVKPHIKLFKTDNSYGSQSTSRAISKYRMELLAGGFTEVTDGIFNALVETEKLSTFYSNLEDTADRLDRTTDSECNLLPLQNTKPVFWSRDMPKTLLIKTFIDSVVDNKRAFKKLLPTYTSNWEDLQEATVAFEVVASQLGRNLMNALCFHSCKSYVKREHYITLHLTPEGDIYWAVGKVKTLQGTTV